MKTHLVLIALATAVLFPILGLHFPLSDAIGPGIVLLLLLGVAFHYSFTKQEPSFVLCAKALLVLVTFSTFFPVLTYEIATTAHPLADDTLKSIDEQLGFSAGSVILWVNQHEFIENVLKIAYFSIIPQTALLIMYLGFTNRATELDRFLKQFMLCAMVTAAGFYLFPAKGTMASYNVPVPGFCHGYLADLNALRSGAMTTITRGLRD